MKDENVPTIHHLSGPVSGCRVTHTIPTALDRVYNMQNIRKFQNSYSPTLQSTYRNSVVSTQGGGLELDDL